MFFKSIFSSITFFILGSLVVLYLAFLSRKKIDNFNLFALINLVLILILSTGGISSPMFFLLYILSFAVAFVFDPKVVFLFTIGAIVLFFPQALKTDLTRNLIVLFSLFLLSPIAFFLGTDYAGKKQAKRKIEDMKKKAEVIEREVEDVLRDTRLKLTPRIAAKLSEALAFLLLVTCYLLLVTAPARAQTMSNKDYKVKMQGFNAISGTTANTNYEVRSTVGELGPIISEGVNFKVRTGLENIVSALPFSTSLSSDIVDFGSLSPTNPIIRTVDLTIYSLSTYGYSVLAFEDHPLQSDPDASGQVIPNTTCDNGQCSEDNAQEWKNTLTYGFGYRCDNVTGFDCNSSFSNAEGTPSGPNFYKSFADNSNSMSPKSIMAGIGSKNKDVRLSYKVNISGNQAQGIYTNIITFIAVPNF